jgi:hypothetical protein
MMNEIVKQIWDEAASYVNPLSVRGEWQRQFVTKFTELIVSECSMFLVTEMESEIGSKIADRFANRLEKHFGIEE